MLRTRHKIQGWPLGLGVAALLFLVYLLRHLLIPFALAGALAYALGPVLDFLHKKTGASRGVLATILYGGLLCLATLGIWLLVRSVAPEVAQWRGNPQHAHDVIARLLGGENRDICGIHLDANLLADRLQQRLREAVSRIQPRAAAEMAMGAVFTVTLFWVLLFYFLWEGPALWDKAQRLVPPEHRPALREFAAQAHPILLRYIQGMFVIVFFTVVVVWIGAGPVFHLPNAGLLALVSGLLELLPVVGPTASAFLLGGAAALHGQAGWVLVGFCVFFLGLRLVIDQIVGPIVLGRAVTLPPVVVIFAFLAGGVVFGFLGVLLAIPAAALLKIWINNYYALPVE